jgi:GTP cyclohydrolase I
LTQTIGYDRLNSLVKHTANEIKHYFFGENTFERAITKTLRCYPIPSGGVPAALAMLSSLPMMLVDNPNDADFILDDLVDSGATVERHEHYGKPIFALIDKRAWEHGDEWVVWPWEGTAEKGITDHVTRLIQYIGDDPQRGGLLETPERFAKAWKFWGSGYGQDPDTVLKVFEDGAEGCDEMVVVKAIPFYTHCEHHLAPFFGTATIAYLPNQRIVGLSKLSRVLKIFARRLQVQERMTQQVANAIMAGLDPLGCGVVVRARHLCMESRGLCEQGSETITSALRGVFKDDPSVRAEFLALAR